MHENAFLNCTNLETVKIKGNEFNVASFTNCSDFEVKLESDYTNLTIENNLLVFKQTIDGTTYKVLLAVLPKYDEKSLTISNYDAIFPYTFSICTKPTEVIIDGSNVNFDEKVFPFSKVKTVEIKKCGHTYIPSNLFYQAYNLQKVIIPEGILRIEDDAFRYCYKLKTVELPSTVSYIGQSAFSYYLKLKSIDLSNVAIIDSSAFSNCESLNVDLPENLKYLGGSAFSNTNLKSVVIPGSLKAIPSVIFNGCRNLKKIEIGDGIVRIDYLASNCPKLKKIIVPSSVKYISAEAFNENPAVDVEIDSGNPYYEAKDHVIIEKATHIVIGSYGQYSL
ncbi:cell surface protein, putative [Trichomonas vaginalis G3]|uniref:Cell surface protein, putative n=1 Tax=Trichomonas vaginalis (strain ATCC PRA-98 / G3) TaxID=412133 RepID=A2DAM1_TRIV3|nr:leucine-rich repeats (6 copies)-containing protein [Trichomonas vaginalis G3]EAY22524.1 cell surface protein, putative [Trichomonas vaginalis G3]KAI5497257.1 leucine-rich repeats (6 copies)-containing protein [Trichomonas vaginalis G3]|eukprot:XP_001583510.1 cell surface protein [Trichomonas vaginalis G3]